MITENQYRQLCLLKNTDREMGAGTRPSSFGKSYFKDVWNSYSQKKYRFQSALILGKLKAKGYLRHVRYFDNYLYAITAEGKQAIIDYEQQLNEASGIDSTDTASK